MTLLLNSELLETACRSGVGIATQLDAGDTTPLPDQVSAWLDQHSTGVSSPRLAERRNELRMDLAILSTPATPEQASAIGAAIRAIIDHGNRLAVNLGLSEATIAGFFRIINDPDDTDTK